MTLAFVVGIVGYLVGMLHGKRLSASPVSPRWIAMPSTAAPARTTAEADWRWYQGIIAARALAAHTVIVNTQYNAHPPVS